MKKYTLEVTDNGSTISVKSQADGYSGLEVVGLLELKLRDMHDMFRGRIDPEKAVVFERRRVEEDGNG